VGELTQISQSPPSGGRCSVAQAAAGFTHFGGADPTPGHPSPQGEQGPGAWALPPSGEAGRHGSPLGAAVTCRQSRLCVHGCMLPVFRQRATGHARPGCSHTVNVTVNRGPYRYGSRPMTERLGAYGRASLGSSVGSRRSRRGNPLIPWDAVLRRRTTFTGG
jgi:hypothetical protein